MQCDVDGTCWLQPSPGYDGHLMPQNTFAVWFFRRWRTLGDGAWNLLPSMSARQKLLLMDQLSKLMQLYRSAVQEAGDPVRQQEEMAYDN